MPTDPTLSWLADELLDIELPDEHVPIVAQLLHRRVAQLERAGRSAFAILPELYAARSWSTQMRVVADRLIADIAKRGWSDDLVDLLKDVRREVRLQTVTQVLPHVQKRASRRP